MQYPCVLMISGNFYPRPPRGGRRPIFREHPPEHDISIHALREEGDDFFISFATSSTDFYPRPPRGGRQRLIPYSSAVAIFLSTPSARRATEAS